MQAIAPVTENTSAELSAKGVEKSYMFASHSTATDMYYAIFEKDGIKCVVYFEATQKALQIFRFYNMITVVTPVSR
jgi:aspartate/glutamate racemase